MGFSSSLEAMKGRQYFFSNTLLQPAGERGVGGLGTNCASNHNRHIRLTTTRNNIFHTRTQDQSISQQGNHSSNDLNYDLISSPASTWPSNQEGNGIYGTPTYVGGGSWNFITKTANFKLLSSSLGLDDGEVINNFIDKYNGAGPDVGAHEKSSRDVMFGTSSNFAPDQLSANPITFTSATAKAYGDAPFTLAATATSGGAIIYSLVSGPATLSGSTLTITGAGTIVVTASVPATGVYANNEFEQTITVSKANQTVTFGAISDKTYPSGNFTVSATASSGLTPTFSIVSGPSTISGSTITLTGVGTVVVRASQTGNTNYNAASNIDQSFNVTSSSLPYSGTIEAESSAVARVDAHTTVASGWSGTGYAQFTNPSGSSMEWTVNITNASDVSLVFRYANGSGSSRNVNLTVNGTISVLAFPATANWSTLANVTINKNLVAGSNTIKLTSTGTWGAWMDYLKYEVLQTGLIEAESSAVTKVNATATLASGWSGTGYAQFTNPSGSSMEWTVNKANASNASLVFRYANGSGSSRNVDLTVNGTTTVLALPATASWNTLANVTIIKNLVAGNNTIKLTSTGTWGGWMDYMSYTSSPSPNPLAAAPERNLALKFNDSSSDTEKGINIFPNPANETVNVSISATEAGKGIFRFINSNGTLVKTFTKAVNQAGKASFAFPIDGLAPGVYIIDVNLNGTSQQAKLLVQ